MFHVGQKVVCIKKGKWSKGFGWERVPLFGHIYTVRAIDRNGLLLLEVINPIAIHDDGLDEPHWCETRFRPVVERKTDISIFTRMLTPNKVSANAT